MELRQLEHLVAAAEARRTLAAAAAADAVRPCRAGARHPGRRDHMAEEAPAELAGELLRFLSLVSPP